MEKWSGLDSQQPNIGPLDCRVPVPWSVVIDYAVIQEELAMGVPQNVVRGHARFAT